METEVNVECKGESCSDATGSMKGIGGFVYKNSRFGQETTIARIGWYCNEPSPYQPPAVELVPINKEHRPFANAKSF